MTRTAHHLSSPALVTWDRTPGTPASTLGAYLHDGTRRSLRGFATPTVYGYVLGTVYVTPDTLDCVREEFETTEQAKAWVEAMLIACHAMER